MTVEHRIGYDVHIYSRFSSAALPYSFREVDTMALNSSRLLSFYGGIMLTKIRLLRPRIRIAVGTIQEKAAHGHVVHRVQEVSRKASKGRQKRQLLSRK